MIWTVRLSVWVNVCWGKCPSARIVAASASDAPAGTSRAMAPSSTVMPRSAAAVSAADSCQPNASID
ncbi:MAG: hypothetical protein QM733_21185 [Ilumatobacteraceae bacterium]